MIELDILETQENQLRFHQFDGEEAYQLGTFMAEYAKEHGITIAFSIRLANGYVIFQYGPDGTSFNNQRWMDRKFRTVCNWQKSSLYVTYMLERKGQSLEHHGLDSETYALCGGGFPIRVNNFEGIVDRKRCFWAESHSWPCDPKYIPESSGRHRPGLPAQHSR